MLRYLKQLQNITKIFLLQPCFQVSQTLLTVLFQGKISLFSLQAVENKVKLEASFFFEKCQAPCFFTRASILLNFLRHSTLSRLFVPFAADHEQRSKCKKQGNIGGKSNQN